MNDYTIDNYEISYVCYLSIWCVIIPDISIKSKIATVTRSWPNTCPDELCNIENVHTSRVWAGFAGIGSFRKSSRVFSTLTFLFLLVSIGDSPLLMASWDRWASLASLRSRRISLAFLHGGLFGSAPGNVIYYKVTLIPVTSRKIIYQKP